MVKVLEVFQSSNNMSRYIYACILAFFTLQASAQTVAPPVVNTPINLCIGTPASPLTATGSNLKWVSPINTSVGPEINSTKVEWFGPHTNSGQVKRTLFSTAVNNIMLASVDFKVPTWFDPTSSVYGLFRENGTLLKSTSTMTIKSLGNNINLVTLTFNYNIEQAGNYGLGVYTGEGQIYVDDFNNNSPIVSPLVTIYGTSSGKRGFSNIKYSGLVGTSTAPTPSTEVAGSFDYLVTQTVNGATSTPATIKVNVNSTPAPVVSGPLTFCQGAAAAPLSVLGTNLRWTGTMISSVGGDKVATSQASISQGNPKSMKFTVSEPNTTIMSVDYTFIQWQSVNGLRLGIFKGIDLLATSSTITNLSGNIPSHKVSNIFNYTITTPGEYSIGVVSGSGNIGTESFSASITDPSGSVTITGVTGGSGRLFDNLKFSVTRESSLQAPDPSTAFAGTYTYSVTQTVNGCESPASTVILNINGIISTSTAVNCSDKKVTFSAAATAGYTIQWFNSSGQSVGSGSTFTTPQLPANTIYYVSATNGSCTSPRIPVHAIVNGFTWTGAKNNSWGDAANWSSCGGVPQSGADIVIPGTVTKVVLDADRIITNLVLEGNAKLELNGKTLTVSSVTGTGFITGNASSKLIINGTTNSTLRFDRSVPGTTNALHSLTINNNSRTITLDNPLIVKSVVNITGSSVLHSNGNLTLEATATSNANLGSLANGGSVTGNVKVQNYYTGGNIAYRAFRTITPPVHDVKSPAKGYKIEGYKTTMYVTGAGGEANGFDASPNNGATIKFYNEPKKSNQNQYLTPANTSEIIPQGVGTYFYFRGKKGSTPGNKFVKNANGLYDTPESVVVEYFGEVNSGNISPALSYTNHPGESSSNGFNLVGNPYPSVIDWTKVEKVNVDNKIWVQMANGNFATYDGLVSANGGSQYILPGQGFFVKANASNPSLTFKESVKETTQAPPARLMSAQKSEMISFAGSQFPKAMQSSPVAKMSITLAKDEFSTDETVLVFRNSNSKLYDADDMLYQGEGAVTLTTITPDNQYLAINYSPEVSEQTEVQLWAGFAESGDYSLNLSREDAMGATSIYLNDKFLNKTIDLKTEPVYQFSVDKSLSASFGNRFSLILNPPVTLPVKVTSLKANNTASGVQVKWITESEQNSAYFDVEQSVDGKVFYSLGRVNATGNSSNQLNYSFVDRAPLNGVNYYRLKQVDVDGNFSYSQIASLDVSMTGNGSYITVYPNPASDEIRVNLNGTGTVSQLTVYSVNGNKLLSTDASVLNISSLEKGVYIVETKCSNGDVVSDSRKIIKN